MCSPKQTALIQRGVHGSGIGYCRGAFALSHGLGKTYFGKLPRHKHGFYSWPELVPVILLLAASKFLSITWFDLNEISPLRIALG